MVDRVGVTLTNAGCSSGACAAEWIFFSLPMFSWIHISSCCALVRPNFQLEAKALFIA